MAYEDHPTFDVAIVTPEGPAFDGEAHMLVVPGQAGEIGVLARHAPLVATLKAGLTRVHVGGGELVEFATGPGFFKVELDKALALVDDAVDVREIDDERARQQLEAAKAELARSRPASRPRIAGSSSSASSTQRTACLGPHSGLTGRLGQQRSRTSTAELSSQTYTQTDSAEPSPASA